MFFVRLLVFFRSTAPQLVLPAQDFQSPHATSHPPSEEGHWKPSLGRILWTSLKLFLGVMFVVTVLGVWGVIAGLWLRSWSTGVQIFVCGFLIPGFLQSVRILLSKDPGVLRVERRDWMDDPWDPIFLPRGATRESIPPGDVPSSHDHHRGLSRAPSLYLQHSQSRQRNHFLQRRLTRQNSAFLQKTGHHQHASPELSRGGIFGGRASEAGPTSRMILEKTERGPVGSAGLSPLQQLKYYTLRAIFAALQSITL